jgi:type VI secretion system protein ImpF
MRMAQPGGLQGATREAVQPSLWDRLVIDLPGVVSEVEGLRQALTRDLGEERLAELLAEGPRALDAAPGLTAGDRERLARLMQQERRREALAARSVVVSPEVLREAVRRDIEALFNTERFESGLLLTAREAEERPGPPSLDDFPEVRRSVVNYGVPAFAGRSARDFDREALAKELKAVLAAFEPRLKESATRVTVSTSDKAAGLAIEIDGLLIMTPAPERLRLRTMVDLDTGRARTTLRDG